MWNRFVTLSFFVALLSGISSDNLHAHADNQTDCAQTAEKKNIPLKEGGWTEEERWVWSKICSMEEANFNARYEEFAKGDYEVRQTKERLLRAKFLNEIFSGDRLTYISKRSGVHIRGAFIVGALHWTNGVIDFPVVITDSLFKDEVKMSGLETTKFLDFERSHFLSSVNFEHAKIGKSVSMVNARIASLQMREIEIGSQLILNGAKFWHGADRILCFEKTVREGECELDLEGAKVGSKAFLREGGWFPKVNMVSARLSDLQIAGSTFYSLNLTDARIENEFHLGSRRHCNAKWYDSFEERVGPQLRLRNATVRSVQDTKDSWPKNIDLMGFTYRHLGGFDTDKGSCASNGSDAFVERSTRWMKCWLGQEKYCLRGKERGRGDLEGSRRSQQPYLQLSNVLMSTGYPEKAQEILIAGRENSRRSSVGIDWAWQTLLKWTIGYGYKPQYAIIWSTLFVVVGAFIIDVLKTFYPRENEQTSSLIGDGWWYSMDVFLPIVHLDSEHKDYKPDVLWVRTYFYFHQIIGFVLASFLVAGLAGLTK